MCPPRACGPSILAPVLLSFAFRVALRICAHLSPLSHPSLQSTLYVPVVLVPPRNALPLTLSKLPVLSMLYSSSSSPSFYLIVLILHSQ